MDYGTDTNTETPTETDIVTCRVVKAHIHAPQNTQPTTRLSRALTGPPFVLTLWYTD
jgi:hypothetical protein